MRIPVRWGDLDAMGRAIMVGKASDEARFS